MGNLTQPWRLHWFGRGETVLIIALFFLWQKKEMSMSTQLTLPRISLFERTTPAKLSRSSVLLWILICLTACSLGFSYDWHNRLLQNLGSHTIPLQAAGRELGTDFAGMDFDAQIEEAGLDESQVTKARADYALWHNKATRDLEAVGRIPAAADPWYVFHRKTVADDSKPIANMASLLYQQDEDLAAALQLRASGKTTEGAELFAHARMNTQLQEQAQSLIESSSSAYETAFNAYYVWHSRFVNFNYATAAIVLAFLAWQYLFILLNCRVVIQGTLVSILLCGFAFAYTDLGYRIADHHRHEAFWVFIPNNLATAVPEQRTTTDWVAQNNRAQAASAQILAFQGHISKAQGHIRYLLAALVALLIAGQTYKLAVFRAKRYYG
jgi:hypothetical protein